MNVTSAQMSDLLDMSQVDKLKGDQKDRELKKACADFEGVLLNFMFQSMEKTVGEGGVLGDSFQRKMYQSLYLQKISEKVAEERDFGIGDALYRQLSAATKNENSGDSDTTPAGGIKDAPSAVLTGHHRKPA